MKEMKISPIELYKILEPKLGQKESQTLVDFIEDKIEYDLSDETHHLATKSDLESLRGDIHKSLKDSLKWTIVLWASNIAILLGAVYFMLNQIS